MSLSQISVYAILKHVKGISAYTVFQYSILTIVQLLYLIPNFFEVSDNLTSISLSVSVVIPTFVLLSVIFLLKTKKFF